jgi:hypothetical protein
VIGDGTTAAKRRLRIIPTFIASVVSSAAFVVVLAVVARNTADGVTAPGAFRDAGFDDVATTGVVAGGADAGDAGVADAGPPVEYVTVDVGPDAGPEADAGPADVAGPPYDPATVIAAAVDVTAVCAAEALRWDPSLGGPFTLSVSLPSATKDVVEVFALGLRSPVLERCLQRRGPLLSLPGGARHNLVPQRVQARAHLGAAATVDVSDISIMGVAADADAGVDATP